MPAPAPTRATTNLTLNMGMMTVPLQLFTGVEKNTSIKRSEYDGDGRKVGRVNIAFCEGFPPEGTHPAVFLEDTRKQLIDELTFQDQPDPEGSLRRNLEGVRFYQDSDVLSCVETEAGLVEITDAEVETCNPYAGQDKTAEVLCFQPHSVLASGVYLPIGVMQVRPVKKNAAADRSFTILLKAMRKHGVFALVRVISRNKPHYAALLPTGRLYNLAFDDQIRTDLPLPKPDLDPTQVRMAETLVEAMIEEQPRVLVDELTPLVSDYIDQKANEGKVVKANLVTQSDGEPAAAPGSADLMAQLEASVAAAKAKKADA